MDHASRPALESPAAAPTRDSLGFSRRCLEIRSGTVDYVDEGEGPPIVLLHGAPMTSLGFLRLIRSLRADHHVIAPDLPGFGASAASASFQPTLPGYAAAIEEFLRAVGLRRFVLFVHDSSACMGLAAAARIAPQLAGLVVADTVPLPITGRAWPVRLVLAHLVASPLVRFLNRRLNLLPWLVATVAPVLKPLAREERRALTAQFDTPARRDRILDVFEAMGRDTAFMQATAQATAEALRETPTLIVYGKLDPMRLVGGVSRFRALLPRSEVALVPLEAHFPILSSGERVAGLIRRWVGSL